MGPLPPKAGICYPFGDFGSNGWMVGLIDSVEITDLTVPGVLLVDETVWSD